MSEELIEGLQEALEQADEIIQISPEDAIKLPNILGYLVRGQLKYRCWATCVVNGVKTLYFL